MRRVVVQTDTYIPDHCECNVNTKVEFSKLARAGVQPGSVWMTEAKELQQGVYLPRTVVPDRSKEVPIRVMNVSGKPIQLRAGSVITELHPAEALTNIPDGEVIDSEMKKVIEEMVARVDPSVSALDKDRLSALMQEFSPVFSKNESDMGLTNVVMHRIDTGDAQPTRQ